MPDQLPPSEADANVRKPAGDKRWLVGIVIAFWLIMILGGSAKLWQYAMQPGEVQMAARFWPQVLDLDRATDRCTLVMAVHPRCPCTRASLQELAKIMRYATHPVSATVLVSRPAGTSNGFENSDIWTQAMEIPGAKVQVDEFGRAAKLLGLSVSGSTSVYDAHGHLLFSGGITSARGHAGDNAGCDAIIGILSGRSSGLTATPVYGCDLFAPGESCTTLVTTSETSPCCK